MQAIKNNATKLSRFLNPSIHIALLLLAVFILSSCGLGPVKNTDASENTDTSENGGSPMLSFKEDISNSPINLTIASQLTREVFQHIGEGSIYLVKRYVTESGGGTKDGSSWENAWAARELKDRINNITDADTSKVYLIMVAGGTYKPTYDGNRGVSFSMKDYVVIMGGFQTGGGWESTGTTVFSGDIDNDNALSGNSYHVFNHNNVSLNHSHLYGVVITGGNANGSGTQAQGGGMRNMNSSPNLTATIFRDNQATLGGGMYNSASSPVLAKTVFVDNIAVDDGGGIYSSGGGGGLTGKNMVFTNNRAQNGGGMYNHTMSSFLNNTVFSGNTATRDGGGSYNHDSSFVLNGVAFIGNSAENGGGLAINNNTASSFVPLILNAIFSANTITGEGADIAVLTDNTNPESIRIAGSVLGMGLPSPLNAISRYGGNARLTIRYLDLANGPLNLGEIKTTPEGLSYPTIQGDSSAIDRGLFVKKNTDFSTYSFSTNFTTWYTNFTTNGTFSGINSKIGPLDEEQNTTDIIGNKRNGRPDAGVSEFRR